MFELLRQSIDKRINLTDEEFAITKSYFNIHKLRKKAYFLTQNEICRYESFVVSGCLKSFHTDQQGNEHILRFSMEDHWAGDLDSFVNQTPSSFSIRAIEPTALLVIDKTALYQLYQRVPKLETFFRLLNEKALMATSQRVIQSVSQSAQERYSQFTHTYPALLQRVPLKDIAAYLGMTPVFLSRLRRKEMTQQRLPKG